MAESQRATAAGPSADRLDGAGEQSFSFSDFLSIINPLQHLPVVGTLYRAITGDTIKPAQKVIGGILFGGPVGLLSSAFNAIIEQSTGKDIGDQALALVMPSRREQPAPGDTSPETLQQVAAAVDPATATAPSGSDVAPLSRRLLGAAQPLDPAAALTGAERGGGLLAGRARSRGAAGATAGRTLTDYRASAGQPAVVIDNSRTGRAAAPVRLQPSTPLPGDHRTAAPLREHDGRENPSPASETQAAGGEAIPNDPFVAAMMRGLDRYREMKAGKPSPAVIDATL